MVRARTLFLFLWASILICAPASAQKRAEPPTNEFGVFGTYPATNGSLIGVTADRRFYLLGFSYSRLLERGRVCDVRWVSEIMPLELLQEPFIKGAGIQTLAASPSLTENRFTYGFGMNPIGADVIFLSDRRLQLFTGGHGGFSYFTRNVLSARAAQFNFMLDGRAGVRFSLRGRNSLSIAYMFQHMSNAYTAVENPGLDSHMIHLTVTFAFPFNRGKP